MSYRHAWGILRGSEALFDTPLILTRRRQGTSLSPFAEKLICANRRTGARLTPTLESTASELQEELGRLMPEAVPHLRLHASRGFAAEALMQHMSQVEPSVESLDTPAMQTLLRVMRTQNFRDFAGTLVGYDATQTGSLQTMEQAFARGVDRL